MNSQNGFQTNVWGPVAWMFLHTVSLNYNPARKDDYYKFFKSMKGVLPCGACRTNYRQIINGSDPRTRLDMSKLKSRQSLSFWLFLVHNKVQEGIYEKTMLQKDRPMYKNTKSDFKVAMSKFESFRAKCTKTSYGCTVPVKGTRKRSEVHVLPKKNCNSNKKSSIIYHKKC